MPPPLKALIWSAVSSVEQADDDKFSLDAQIDDSLAIADKNGWQVIDTIRIEGHSRNYRTLDKLASAARSKKIPELGFDRLIGHLESADFDILICRDANRFARKASLLYEIVDTILEDCDARIYSLSDGMVDSSNADIWLMVKGYEIGKQMKWIKGELVRSRHKLVEERGLPQHGKFVWSHMKLRDDKGKVTGFVPDSAKSDVILAAARLVIDRIGWNRVEEELFKSGWGENGQPYKRLFFYALFTNPWFWGDACRNYKNQRGPNAERKGLWLVDPSAPIPEGVFIKRGVNQPAISGDLALKLRAEVIRRMTTSTRDHVKAHPFTGLLICKRCGYTMVYASNGSYGGYYCASKYNSRIKFNPTLRKPCEKTWWISELYTKQWLGAVLTQMLDEQNPFGLIAADSAPADDNAQADFDKQLETLEKHIQRLIEKQTTAPDSLADMYDTQIKGLATQRENLLQHMDEVEREAMRYNPTDIEAAFRELTTYETVDVFWAAGNGVVNQLLHRLMGSRRLVVLDHKVVGTMDWHR